MKHIEYQICNCCGRNVAETESSGLVEKPRLLKPLAPIYTESSDEKFLGCNVCGWIQKCCYIFKLVGEDTAAKILLAYHTGGLFITGYECKDCANLDDDEFNMELENNF